MASRTARPEPHEGAVDGWLPAIRRHLGLGGLIGGSLVAIGLATLAVWGLPHPGAPWALTVADHALGAGHPVQAIGAYEAIARTHTSLEVRNDAHRRAALIYSSQLGRPTEARRHLEAVLAVTGAPEARVPLLEQLGEVLLDEGQPAGAAARFESAARTMPHHPLAGQRLLRAAAVLADNRRDRQAVRLYREVEREHPAFAGASYVGRAQLRLRKGQVERALTLFETSLDLTYDPSLVEVAKLGRTVCLERLGDLDSALAELEDVDLPDPIRAERVDALQRRRPKPYALPDDDMPMQARRDETPAPASPEPAPTREVPEGIEVRTTSPAQQVELKTESGATIQIRVE